MSELDDVFGDHDCRVCEDAALKGSFYGRRFIVCPACGNKRCPKASWHEHACTGSNEPGQVGSFYGLRESWPAKVTTTGPMPIRSTEPACVVAQAAPMNTDRDVKPANTIPAQECASAMCHEPAEVDSGADFGWVCRRCMARIEDTCGT